MNKHIFIIPSWYPYGDNPAFGKFIEEQAIYLARYGKIRVSLSLWGQGEFLLSVRNPATIPGKILRYALSRKSSRQRDRGVTELRNPTLYWTHKLLGGNMERLIRANLENLRQSEAINGKVDLIHAHVSYPAGYIASRLSQMTGIPYIITEHMGPFPFEEFLDRAGRASHLIKEPLKNASRVVAVSRFLADEIYSRTGVKSVVIPNHVNEIFFSCSMESIDPSRLIFIGNTTPGKGFPLLLEALKHLTTRGVDFHLTAVGIPPSFKGKLPEELIGRIEPTGLIPKEEIARRLEESAILIHPSSYETFGLAVAESMACGRPVVMTRCGGPDELISPGTGILVDRRDPAILADAIRNAIEHYDRFDPEEIRKTGRQFHPGEVISRLIEIYREIC